MSVGVDYRETKLVVGKQFPGSEIGIYPIKAIGSGTFAKCWLVWNAWAKALEVAKVAKQSRNCDNNVKAELRLLKKMRRADPLDRYLQHIVLFKEQFKMTESTQVVLMEPVGFSLEKITEASQDGLPIEWVKKIAKQILFALQYIHGHGIIHTDIKPENVMVQLPAEHFYKLAVSSLEASLVDGADFDPKLIADISYAYTNWDAIKDSRPWTPKDVATGPRFDYRVKVGDFGSAEEVPLKRGSVVSTRQYRAPEVLLGTELTSALDIWSFGTLMFELATNHYLLNPRIDDLQRANEEAVDKQHLRLIMEMLDIPIHCRGKKHRANFFVPPILTIFTRLNEFGFKKEMTVALGAFLRKTLFVDTAIRSTAVALLTDAFLKERDPAVAYNDREEHDDPVPEEQEPEGIPGEQLLDNDHIPEEQVPEEVPAQEEDDDVQLIGYYPAPAAGIVPPEVVPEEGNAAHVPDRPVNQDVEAPPRSPRREVSEEIPVQEAAVDRGSMEPLRRRPSVDTMVSGYGAPAASRRAMRQVAIKTEAPSSPIANRTRTRENPREPAGQTGTPNGNGEMAVRVTRRAVRETSAAPVSTNAKVAKRQKANESKGAGKRRK